MKHFRRALVLALILVVASVAVYATITTVTSYTRQSTTSFGGWLRYTGTFAASKDTFYIPFTLSKKNAATNLAVLNFYGQTVNGDSFSVCVRWQASSDNTTWASYTIGTDSTTWHTTATSPSWGLSPSVVTVASNGGFQPYNRLMIFGKTGYNLAGGKFRIDLLEQ